MSANDLLSVLETLRQPNVLVLGDLILDRYTCGNANRISQEAPVIVLRADSREERLGGAANVANMLSALEAHVTCCGVVGIDAAGRELRRLLHDSGIDCQGVLDDSTRPTTVKERFVGRASSRHPNQILRVDHESCEPLITAVEKQMIDMLVMEIPRHDALLISDYGKGVCTPRVLRAVLEAAQTGGVPVIVDPSRTSAWEHYRGATLIKPNRSETETAVGRKIHSTDDALAAAAQLCRDFDTQLALITLDRDGSVLVKRDGTGQVFRTNARELYDITGAGDMVMATIGLCLASGVQPADAVRLANVAAGLEVERAGVAVIYRDEIRGELLAAHNGAARKVVPLRQAALAAEERRRRGEKIVFTNGCFDLLHVGHVSYLAEAAALGHVLIVGVNSDEGICRLKGPARPVIGQADRAAMLAALACVDYVVVFEEATPHAMLHAIRPDVLVKGGTYAPSEVVGHEIVEAYGGQVCVTGVVDGISTTNILASLARGESAPSSTAKLNEAATLRRAG